jgi:hypothetical protein
MTMVTSPPFQRAAATGEEAEMLAVLFAVLIVVCLAAPWFGTDTTDSRSESAHPDQGWFPVDAHD